MVRSGIGVRPQLVGHRKIATVLKPDTCHLRPDLLTRLSPSHPRQNAPYFLRRNRQPRRHPRHFAALALPDPRNHKLRKFFADLPERLLAHRSLRPRLQRRMNTSLPKNLRAKRLKVLPNVVGWIRLAGRSRQVIRLACCFRIVKERIALRQSLPQIGVREQQMMLRMLRQIDRLLAKLECAARMASWISAPANLFLHLRIFNHALQNARPDHQNIVLLLLGHLVRRSRLFLSTLKISAIEVDVRGIHVNRAETVMVRTLLIDGPSSLQVLQRFAAKLGQAAASILTPRLMIARVNARRICLSLSAG